MFVVDADMDFILDDNYGADLDRYAHWDADIEISGSKYGQTLAKLIGPKTKVHLIVDHHESLYWWDRYRISNAYCLHIDAHHDMWAPPGDWYDRTEINCGNYLNVALGERIVDNVMYVPSPWRGVYSEWRDIKDNIKPELHSNVKVRSWKYLTGQVNHLPKADVLTLAISPEWFPEDFIQQIKDTCQQLKIPNRTVNARLKQAAKLWSRVYSGKCTGPLSFQFPYASIKECVR